MTLILLRPLLSTLIALLSVLSTGPTLAMAILDDRGICPTIIGEEFDKLVKIVNDAQNNDAPRTTMTKDGESVLQESVRLIGCAPPKEDQRAIPPLKQALADRDTTIRIKAIDGLKNLARAEDQQRYRDEWNGTYDLIELRKTIISILIGALDDQAEEVVSSAEGALTEIPPTDKAVIHALIKVYDRTVDLQTINQSLNALRAIYGVAAAVRERGQTDWLPTLKLARDDIAKHGGLLTAHAAFRALNAEIDALQNAADLEKWRWLKQNWPKLIYAFSALHLLLFIAVIVAARWSIRCRRLLCDPIFSRVSIYVYPCIKFWWPLQCWLLDGYVKRCAVVLRSEHKQRYIEVPLSCDGRDMAPHEVAALWTKQKRFGSSANQGWGRQVSAAISSAPFICTTHLQVHAEW
ncbi:HEAT repeat domain-containing protein [Bradyrhizobium betae]